ncbi:MAG TPA: hypothetical protein VFX59_25395 [Polyangiales bacterium]|nr:hypothetical protein [Polyangiales bacterium]
MSTTTTHPPMAFTTLIAFRDVSAHALVGEVLNRAHLMVALVADDLSIVSATTVTPPSPSSSSSPRAAALFSPLAVLVITVSASDAVAGKISAASKHRHHDVAHGRRIIGPRSGLDLGHRRATAHSHERGLSPQTVAAQHQASAYGPACGAAARTSGRTRDGDRRPRFE